MASTARPQRTLMIAMDNRYRAVARLPRRPTRTESEVTLVAGPTSRKTRAVPGLTPFIINAAAMGVEAVAQI